MGYFNKKKILFEGPDSKNIFAFKQYNSDEIILGKPMKEHLKFAMSYWHTLCGGGTDMFGEATINRKWNLDDKLSYCMAKVDAGFEFMQILGIEYFCFHDRDIACECDTLKETNELLDKISDYILKKMRETKIKCLWGTANCFNNKRFVHGAATSCNSNVFIYTAAQIKKAMDITKKFDGQNYVFWGGREGYDSLLNTDTLLELNNYAYMLQMAVDYAKKINFKGQLLIEPKPKEPTKHQYDFDTQTVLSFLRKYNLESYYKMNIEANHATLAGHTFQHELNICRINNCLGSIDANQGDNFLGWDTDQFPTNVYETTLAMLEVLKNGGLGKGGLNFDSKVRRGSFDNDDLLISYIVGMDTFAKGLRVAAKIIEDNILEDFIKKRYSSYKTEFGKKIINQETDFDELYEYAINNEKIENESSRQEMLEGIINSYIYK